LIIFQSIFVVNGCNAKYQPFISVMEISINASFDIGNDFAREAKQTEYTLETLKNTLSWNHIKSNVTFKLFL